MMLKIYLIILFLELLIDIHKLLTVPYNIKHVNIENDIDMYKTKFDNIVHYIDTP